MGRTSQDTTRALNSNSPSSTKRRVLWTLNPVAQGLRQRLGSRGRHQRVGGFKNPAPRRWRRLTFGRRKASTPRTPPPLPEDKPHTQVQNKAVDNPRHFKSYSLIFRYSVRSEMPNSSAACFRLLRCFSNARRINSRSESCKRESHPPSGRDARRRPKRARCILAAQAIQPLACRCLGPCPA